ncbi:unnamed protein product [Victoria cruziana]
MRGVATTNWKENNLDQHSFAFKSCTSSTRWIALGSAEESRILIQHELLLDLEQRWSFFLFFDSFCFIVLLVTTLYLSIIK